jgi:hypothetical protein
MRIGLLRRNLWLIGTTIHVSIEEKQFKGTSTSFRRRQTTLEKWQGNCARLSRVLL